MNIRPVLGAMVFAVALCWPVAASAREGSSKPTLTLREVAGSAGERTYEADLRVGDLAVNGADLDIGGLGDDPDLRVPTQPMAAVGAVYRAELNFSSGGDWVLVVRAHAPVQIVELFTVRIDGIAAADHSAAAATPSRRALLRLQPAGTNASSVAATTHDGTSAVGAVPLARSFDFVATLIRAIHSLGAVAWLVSVVGLVLANRLGPGWGREQLTSFIAQPAAAPSAVRNGSLLNKRSIPTAKLPWNAPSSLWPA